MNECVKTSQIKSNLFLYYDMNQFKICISMNYQLFIKLYKISIYYDTR